MPEARKSLRLPVLGNLGRKKTRKPVLPRKPVLNVDYALDESGEFAGGTAFVNGKFMPIFGRPNNALHKKAV